MEFSALDWIIGAFILSGCIQGYRRGMVNELVSVVAWLLSYFGARTYALDIAEFLPIQAGSVGFRYAAGFATAFVLIIFILTLASKVVRNALHAAGAGALDTSLGVVIGGVKSLLWLLVLSTILLWTPFKESDWWLDSKLAPQLVRILFVLKPVLPEVLADKITV